MSNTEMNFGSRVLAAAIYTAATVQTLATAGATYYRENEDQILSTLEEVTQCFLAGTRKAYQLVRTAAITTYEAGVTARALYTEYSPDVIARAELLDEQAKALVAGVRARFAA